MSSKKANRSSASSSSSRPSSTSQTSPTAQSLRGYTLIRRAVLDKDYLPSVVQLLVPDHVKEALELQAHQERQQRIKDDQERARLANEALQREEELKRRLAAPVVTKDIIRQMNARATNTLPVLEEPLAGRDYDPKQAYPVYPVDAPNNLLSRSSLNTLDKDMSKRDLELYKRMTGQ